MADIERDEQMDRTYIPLPGGWEVQTRGNGSTFRICEPGENPDRLPVPDSPYLHETLERMARDIHADYEALRKRCEAVEADMREGAHPDDTAVDAFGAAMKDKLAAARAKGRGGWSGDEPGMQQRLSDMLRAHVEKGDPRDVANFCMFLHQRGESILPVPAVCECPHRTRCDCLAGCKWGFANGGAE